MGSTAEWHCRRGSGCCLQGTSVLNGLDSSGPSPWPKQHSEEGESWGWGSSQPSSEPGWRLSWAGPPLEESLGAIGEREPCTLKASQEWDSQKWEGAEISSLSTSPLEVQEETSPRQGLEVWAGWAVSRRLCTPNLRLCFCPSKTRAAAQLHPFSAWSCHYSES